MKTMAPGCNCCDRMLIWDLGIPVLDASDFSFLNFTRLAEVYDDLGIGLDFVTGEADPPNSFYAVNPGWDPYVAAVEQGNWTGDIRDYKVILWPFPLSAQNLDELNTPCTTEVRYPTPAGTADHPLFGGLPQWWTDLEDGLWEGRLVWLTGGNSVEEEGADLMGYASNTFLNTLVDQHGMTMNASALSDQTAFTNVGQVVESDLTDGMVDIPLQEITSSIDGGETFLLEGSVGVDLRTDPSWCINASEGSFISNYPIGQRNRVLFPQVGTSLRTVDFVILMTSALFSRTVAPSENDQRFFRNLFRAPIRES